MEELRKVCRKGQVQSSHDPSEAPASPHLHVVSNPGALRNLHFWNFYGGSEKEMATHSSILAWRISWTEEPDRLHSMGSQESDTS